MRGEGFNRKGAKDAKKGKKKYGVVSREAYEAKGLILSETNMVRRSPFTTNLTITQPQIDCSQPRLGSGLARQAQTADVRQALEELQKLCVQRGHCGLRRPFPTSSSLPWLRRAAGFP